MGVRDVAVVALSTVVLHSGSVQAMCGGMLPRRPPQARSTTVVQGATLTNSATRVILARDGDKTTITMSNDFDGDVLEFGLIVPVPTVIKQDQVRLVEPTVFEPLETMSAPTLTETTDPNPCPEMPRPSRMSAMAESAPRAASKGSGGGGPRASQYGVKVESHFAVGAYDIAILSAKDASKLIEWLRLFHYDVSPKAEQIIGSYLAQNMKFFVTKVDLRKMKREGRTFLQPLQVSYTAPRFMLPIRLGMVNADGPQELTVFGITPHGRIEPVNYRTVDLPAADPLPPFVRTRFSDVYRSIFDAATAREGMRVVFTEAAMPLVPGAPLDNGAGDVGAWHDRPPGEGQKILQGRGGSEKRRSGPTAQALRDAGVTWTGPAFLTRLHFTYDEARFPEDLVLQTTHDQSVKRAGYSVRMPWPGSPDQCPQAQAYFERLPARQEAEARTLAALTGQDLQVVRLAAGLPETPPVEVMPASADEEPAPPTEAATPSPWWRFWD